MRMRARSVTRRILRISAIAWLAAALPAFPLGAQQESDPPEGRIAGRVLDARTGRAVAGAQVVVTGTGMGVLAGADGRYTFARVPAGTVDLQVVMIGYTTRTVSGVHVPPGGTALLDVSLEPTALVLHEIVVTAAEARGSVARALDEQRTSINVVSAITREEMARSADGDAAEAVKRVSGVTVQDGKYVFVRGLGERYTTTSLNGTRVPSPEPERKVVPLDLFPSGLLETITTAKTFTPDMPGDFSGAQVDIRTRTFPTRRQQSVNVSTGVNTVSTQKPISFAPGVGREWLGLAASQRGLPAYVESFGNFQQLAPTQAEVNQMVRSFRNVWSARTREGRPKTSVSASVGGNEPLFGRPIGYLVSATYSYAEEAKIEQRRAQALPTEAGGTTEIDRFEGDSGARSVLWGGLANLSALVGSSSRFYLHATYNRTADDEARVETGTSENLGQAFEIHRLRYVERGVASGQVGGEHQVGRAHRIDWRGSVSRVTRSEPDRSEFVRQLDVDPDGNPLAPAWFSVSNEGAVRTFGELAETSLEGSIAYARTFGGFASGARIGLGISGRYTARDASNYAYAISATLDRPGRQLAPEEIFDGRFTTDTSRIFRITPVSQGGSYSAQDGLVGGYALIEWPISSVLRVVAGGRIEHSQVQVDAQSTLGQPVTTRPTYTDLLPSLALHWSLSETQAVRLSASRTLARPEYRELAPVMYREVLGGDNVMGNAELVRGFVQNFDARWEWYPRTGEAVSVALFAKTFQDPIERIYLGTSGTRIVTFANADGARNHGIEVEVRKGLGSLAEALESTWVFANATLMSSEIRVDPSLSGRAHTAHDRPMVGQSPYVVNAGVSYTHEELGFGATALYNVAGRRIVSAAELPLPSVYEQARHALDFSFHFPLVVGLRGKADIENVLDSPYEHVQGSVVREHYRTGRTFTLGVSWQPGS